MVTNDTITAISTGIADAGIGIVRLSGPKAVSIAERVFRRRNGQALADLGSHTITYGFIVDPKNGEVVDEALITVMLAPKTYTREDIVEINCHGGAMALQRILALTIEAGARLADPGEFTRRAFLSGRIDLSQAEAVEDIIRAKNEAGLRAAARQLGGRLSSEIVGLRNDLIEVLAHLEAAVDFSDEDIKPYEKQELKRMIEKSREEMERLIRTASAGRVLREGVQAAIIGKPNVGKSSLLNALVRDNRAIVTNIPGTTRDVVEEVVNVGGVPLRLRDTAGIRNPLDKIEQIGVEMSRRCLDSADLILLVVDGSERLSEEDNALLKEVDTRRAVLVVNKCDLPVKVNIDELRQRCAAVIKISATQGTGIADLESKVAEKFLDGDISVEQAIVTNTRHEAALSRAAKHAREAEKLLEGREPEEITCAVIQDTLDALGEITGETTTEDVLERIFERFCIGK